jgi:hypothetical protein
VKTPWPRDRSIAPFRKWFESIVFTLRPIDLAKEPLAWEEL